MDVQDAMRLLANMIERGSAPDEEPGTRGFDVGNPTLEDLGKRIEGFTEGRLGGEEGDWEGVDASNLARQVVRGTADLNKRKLGKRNINFRINETEHASLKLLSIDEQRSIQLILYEGMKLVFLSRKLKPILAALGARNCEAAVRVLVQEALQAAEATAAAKVHGARPGKR